MAILTHEQLDQIKRLPLGRKAVFINFLDTIDMLELKLADIRKSAKHAQTKTACGDHYKLLLRDLFDILDKKEYE